MTIYDLTLAGLRTGLDQREFSAVELTNAYLERITATNPDLNTFITVCSETALAEADGVAHLVRRQLPDARQRYLGRIIRRAGAGLRRAAETIGHRADHHVGHHLDRHAA